MIKNIQFNDFTPQIFLEKYWQKKPLLIRKAIPNFNGFLTKEDMFKFSQCEDIESRLIKQVNNKWQLANGPFSQARLNKLNGQWSLLVQDVNHLSVEGNALLQLFNFIPYARLDDLMVSIASDQGGVGPHVDSYDVFLLQGSGKRLWKISNQIDFIFNKNAPLKVLENFKSTEEWILEPGDMLYLPPNIAHHGIALGESMTYSIGFRAPDNMELIKEFLFSNIDPVIPKGRYTDPELNATFFPAEIPSDMCKHLEYLVKNMVWPTDAFEVSLGSYLTLPKDKVEFQELDSVFEEFKANACQGELKLDFQSLLLYSANYFFMNGKRYLFEKNYEKDVQQFANKKTLKVKSKMSVKLWKILYGWYLEGFIHIF